MPVLLPRTWPVRLASAATAITLGVIGFDAVSQTAIAQTARPITETPTIQQETTIAFNVTGKVERAPDIAFITTGVRVEAPTARDAMRNNAERMSNVVEVLKEAGVEPRDVQTSNLNLSPKYEYRSNQAPRLIGYTASNAVTIKVRDLDNLGATLDALVNAGANEINGIRFALDNPEAAMREARLQAMQAAEARAELYATSAGMSVRRLVTLNESGGWNQPQPQMMMARAAMDMAESAPTPIEGGSVGYSVTLSLTYELQ